ncbi:MAG: tRNA pseudouridine(55) synthase TruB [Sulfuriferula sp.]
MKHPKRPVHGVLLLDKPIGVTSNAALQAVKRLYQAEKAGHTGTLDPFAGGLLPLCFGEATKFSQYQLEADKRYRAVLQLGMTTTTGDLEGEKLVTCLVQATLPQIEAAIAEFIGPVMQTPPMYSALKYQGKPLYEYARAGITIARAARPVHIRSILLIAFSGTELTLEVSCSAGTYIRTLAEDIGAVLGCGAHLTQLTRLSSGGFVLANAVSPAQLAAEDSARRDSRLAPVDSLVAYLPAIEIDALAAKALLYGQHPQYDGSCSVTGLQRVYYQSSFLGLADLQADGMMVPQRLMRIDPFVERI